MGNMIFINAVESPFNYNRSLDIHSDAIRKNLSLGIRNELLYAKGVDLVAMRSYLLIKHKEEQVLSYNVTLTFKIDGWKDKLANLTKDEIHQSDEVRRMLEITIGFIRGSLFVQEKSTSLEGLNLPILSLPDLISGIKLIEAFSLEKGKLKTEKQ